MLRVSMAMVATFGCIAVAQGATVIPTVYEAGHFFATPTTHDGKTLRLLVDTGGGGVTWGLSAGPATSLRWSRVQCDGSTGLKAPLWAPGKGLPASHRFCGAAATFDTPASHVGVRSDGMVGGWYLSDATWTFDYPGQRLSIESDRWQPDPASHGVALGLPNRRNGKLGSPFPRIAVTVDGVSIDLLLDTGATAHPSSEGLATMHTPVVDGFGVTSYITTTVLNRWHHQHPGWPVVEGADDLFGKDKTKRSIQVPSLDIAGWDVGPVWFTERPDAAFEVMSSYMDDTVHGAVGGNVLQAFRMTVDYRHRRAYFSCVEACTEAK